MNNTYTPGKSGYVSATIPAVLQGQEPPRRIGQLQVDGDATINGTLTVMGEKEPAVHERLDRIEEMLKLPPVLRCNEQLEQKYDELQKAREEYERLEQKYITWENMKKDV